VIVLLSTNIYCDFDNDADDKQGQNNITETLMKLLTSIVRFAFDKSRIVKIQ